MQGKCHFMCLGNKTENETFLFNNNLMANSNKQNTAGVTTDGKINFKVTQMNYIKKLPVLLQKAFLKNFTIFEGKHLYWSLFLIKLQAFRPANLLKRNSNTGVFLLITSTNIYYSCE